jgi:hypothetical protein
LKSVPGIHPQSAAFIAAHIQKPPPAASPIKGIIAIEPYPQAVQRRKEKPLSPSRVKGVFLPAEVVTRFVELFQLR